MPLWCWAQTPQSRLAKRVTPQQVRFFEYLPQGYNAGNLTKKYPVIIYLHDSDARGVNGTNMDLILNQGPLLHVNTNAHNMEFVINGVTEQFIVLAPQLSTSFPSFDDVYEDFYRHISNSYNIDTDRVYLTGYNMGAGSALTAAATRPDRYAGVAPVATNSWPATGAACSISGAGIPVWALHGSINNGNTTSTAAPQTWVNQINTQCGTPPNVAARLTIFDNTDNATVWGQAYLPNNSIPQLTPRNMYQWFLQYRKSDNLNLLGNLPPVLSLPAEIRRFLPVANIVVDASASTDPDGQIVYWNWRFLSGSWATMTTANTNKLTLTNINGEIINTYEVTAVDNRGGVTVGQVRVIARNPPPPGCERARHLIAPPRSIFNGRQLGVQPGDTIWVGAGRYDYIDLVEVVGTASQPIVVINCGGQAVIGRGNPSYGITMTSCRYVKVTGSGSAAHRYGIWVNRSGTPTQPVFAFAINGISSDIEVERVHISQVSQHGFSIKSDPQCDNPQTWRENFVMRNINLHHNKVDSTGSEGMYLGFTGSFRDCGGVKRYAHLLRNVRIWENDVSNTGNDGIQPSLVDSVLLIYNNRLTNIGLRNEAIHNEGIIVGERSNAEVFNNIIRNCTGSGIMFFGRNLKFYNNVVEAGDGGYFNDRSTETGPGSYQIYNNTIIRLTSPGNAALFLDKTGTAPLINTFVRNNLIIYKMAGNPIGVSGPAAAAGVMQSNNLIYRNFAAAMLVDSVGNYAPRAGSPAIDAGVAITGLVTDMVGTSRPQGASFDVGSHEFRALTNLPPLVSAGTDRTFHLPLPTTGVILNGTATDSDGSIASVQWEQVSGPNQAQLTNANTLSLTVRQVVRGTYVFRLTATDNQGLRASSQVAIKFNSAPVIASFSGGVVTLPATSTRFNLNITDVDGTVAGTTCEQVFGPATATITGGTTTAPTVGNLTLPGIYRFLIRATDNDGAVGSRVVAVQVNRAIELMIWGPSAIMLPTNQVTLIGMANSPDASILSIAWTQVDGPSTARLLDPNKLNMTAQLLVQGTYTFRMRVLDTNRASASRDFRITVVANFSATTLQLFHGSTSLIPVVEGTEVNYAQLNVTNISQLNIRANTLGAVGSVRFALHDGTRNLVVASDNTAPFTLFGGNLNEVWALSQGTYKLTVTPYSGANLSGAEGQTMVVNFRVVNNTANIVGTSAPVGPSGAPAGSPSTARQENQSEDRMENIIDKLGRYLDQGGVISVRDGSGRELFRAEGTTARAGLAALFANVTLPGATYIYFVSVPGQSEVITGRFAVQK